MYMQYIYIYIKRSNLFNENIFILLLSDFVCCFKCAFKLLKNKINFLLYKLNNFFY